MSITSYNELQTALQNWLDDTNTFPAARCQEFISLTEADLNRRLRVSDNLTSVSGTTTTNTATIDLPAGFGGVQSLVVSVGGSYYPLKQMAQNAAEDAYYGYAAGAPQAFTLQSSTATLYPTPDGEYAYTLRYWVKLDALSDSNTSNWVLASYPDIYLFGALSHAEGFRVNDERLLAWRTQYETALQSLLAQSAADGIAGRTFMFTEGGTP